MSDHDTDRTEHDPAEVDDAERTQRDDTDVAEVGDVTEEAGAAVGSGQGVVEGRSAEEEDRDDDGASGEPADDTPSSTQQRS